jgi:hypothetical protein
LPSISPLNEEDYKIRERPKQAYHSFTLNLIEEFHDNKLRSSQKLRRMIEGPYLKVKKRGAEGKTI